MNRADGRGEILTGRAGGDVAMVGCALQHAT